jgi:hypothetical protein
MRKQAGWIFFGQISIADPVLALDQYFAHGITCSRRAGICFRRH